MSAEEFQRIAAGDESAMEALFRAHYRPLCAFAYQYLKDRDRTEDLVQELFFKLWEDRARLNITTSMKAYLFTAVRNRCLTALKQSARLVPLHSEVQEKGQEEAVDEADHAERAARVRAAIADLPTERRKVFELSRYEGLKYHEIADRLGISVKTVENQMGKALKTLRTELADLLPVIGWLLWWNG